MSELMRLVDGCRPGAGQLQTGPVPLPFGRAQGLGAFWLHLTQLAGTLARSQLHLLRVTVPETLPLPPTGGSTCLGNFGILPQVRPVQSASVVSRPLHLVGD